LRAFPAIPLLNLIPAGFYAGAWLLRRRTRVGG
jgi:hypothetical protein